MQCPVDQTTLVIADRNGVEIDYCPNCRGVWLDRKELDEIIRRSQQYAQPAAPQPYPAEPPRPEYREQRRDYPQQQPRDRHYDDDDDDYRHHDGHGHHKKHKKESFLSDIFDF